MKRDILVQVKNVRRFIEAMQDLWNRAVGIEGMGLVIGERGMGKTRTSIWYVANVLDTIYCRAKANWSPGWMYREILFELGMAGDRILEHLHNQAVSALKERPRMIFVDEIKHLLTSSRLIESLKDLHDASGCPIVFLAETGEERALARFVSLFDRFNQIVQLTQLDAEDIEMIITSLMEIEMDEEARKAFIDLTEKRFRPTIIGLFKLERWCKTMKVEPITASHVRGILAGKGALSRNRTIQPKKAATITALEQG